MAPFLEVAESSLPASGTQVQVDVTFGGQTKTDINLTSALDRFTVSLPADARGPIGLQATAKNADSCIVASGTTSEAIAANQVYNLTVSLSGAPMPICPGSPPVRVSVTKTGGGGGTIVHPVLADDSFGQLRRSCGSRL